MRKLRHWTTWCSFNKARKSLVSHSHQEDLDLGQRKQEGEDRSGALGWHLRLLSEMGGREGYEWRDGVGSAGVRSSNMANCGGGSGDFLDI